MASCGLVAARLLRARRPRMRILSPTPLPTMRLDGRLAGAEPPCVVDHVAKRGMHTGLPIASRRLGVVSEGARGILPASLRAHARSGDPVAIAAYLGRSDQFDWSITDFSQRYADQNELDHEAFVKAIRSGRLEALQGV